MAQNHERIIRENREFEAQKARELRKTEAEKQQILNSIINQKEALRVGEAGLVQRTRDLQQRETNVLKLEEERKKVLDSRIEIERLLSSAKMEKQNSALERSKLQSVLVEIDTREKSLKDKEEEIKRREAEMAIREGNINKLTQETNSKMTNVLEIQGNLEPRLKALKDTEESNKKILSEIKQKEIDIDSKLSQDRSLIAEITNRENKMRQKEIEVNSKLEEATRRLLFAGKSER